MIRHDLNLEEVVDFITSQSPESKIYIGSDSERFTVDDIWYADYITVVVVHINGKNGCKVFGQVVRERDYDQRQDRPMMRMMTEAIKTAEVYLKLAEHIGDRAVEIHLDINGDEAHGSSCAVQQAVGYIRGTCNIIPMIKPRAWAASCAADRYKEIA